MNNIVKLDWMQMKSCVLDISDKMQEDKYKPDMIVSVGRGGMIPARLMSDQLSVNEVYMYNIKLYRGIHTKGRMSSEFFSPSVKNKHVLLIDDILDSGETMEFVVYDILKKGAKSVTAAVFVAKKDSKITATYYGRRCEKDEWIMFPWEEEETRLLTQSSTH